jgi:hypothetical protein
VKTNVCVGDVTETAVQRNTFSDAEDGIYEYELERQKTYEYDQRTTDITVIKTGQDVGVRTLLSCRHSFGAGAPATSNSSRNKFHRC